MKFRHAAALAIVGWYLMLTPPDLPVANRASVSNWEHESIYDTLKKCEQARHELLEQVKKNGFKLGNYNPSDVERSFSVAEFIKDDDPRLKSK